MLVNAGGVEGGAAGEVGKRVALVPHLEKPLFAVEDHVAGEVQPPTFARLIGDDQRIGRVFAPRMKREGHVLGPADDHLVNEQLGQRAGLIDAPLDQGLGAGGQLRGGLQRLARLRPAGPWRSPRRPMPRSRGRRRREGSRVASWVVSFSGGAVGVIACDGNSFMLSMSRQACNSADDLTKSLSHE